MKPFNLEEAKAGKPVCARDGRDVRLFCFDRKHDDYPIVGLITSIKNEKEIEHYESFTATGYAMLGKTDSNADLFMKSEKKQGWINIYPNNEVSDIYLSKEEAIKNSMKGVVATIKIEWEE